MSQRKTVVHKPPPPPDDSMECTPSACAKICGASIMFVLSLGAVSALGVIAGGSFWTAQSIYRITDNAHYANVALCCGTDAEPNEGQCCRVAAMMNPAGDYCDTGHSYTTMLPLCSDSTSLESVADGIAS